MVYLKPHLFLQTSLFNKKGLNETNDIKTYELNEEYFIYITFNVGCAGHTNIYFSIKKRRICM